MTRRDTDPARGLNAAVAAELNGERVAAGMTFDQLADVSGISKQQLMRLLSTKKRHIDVEVLELLARVFGTDGARVIAAAEERRTRPDYIEPGDVEEARAAAKSVLKKGASPPRGDRKSSRSSRRSTG